MTFESRQPSRQHIAQDLFLPELERCQIVAFGRTSLVSDNKCILKKKKKKKCLENRNVVFFSVMKLLLTSESVC